MLSAETVSVRLERLESDVSKIKLLLQKLTREDRDNLSFSPIQPTKTNAQSYRIRSGDSYWSVAQHHKTTVPALLKANPGIDPHRLTIGTKITIPLAKMPQKPSKTTRTYRVKSGDILGQISLNHGIPLQRILSANPGLNPQVLKIGAILNIPGTSLKPSTVHENQAPQTPRNDSNLSKAIGSKKIKNHKLGGGKSKRPRLVVIRENLRFSEIAERYETTVKDLNSLNQRNLSPQQLIKSGSQFYILSP